MVDDEDALSGVTTERWDWTILPAVFFSLIRNMLGSLENAFDSLTLGCISHLKWRRSQRAFHEAVSRDIETLTS